MELAGGMMIMVVLLVLLCAAALISIPVLILTLGRRVSEVTLATEKLSVHIVSLDEQLSQLALQVTQKYNVHDENQASRWKQDNQNPEG